MRPPKFFTLLLLLTPGPALACGGGGGGGGGGAGGQSQLPPACIAAMEREPSLKALLARHQAQIDEITRLSLSNAQALAAAATGTQLDSAGKAAQNFGQAAENLERQKELARAKAEAARAYARELGEACQGAPEAEPLKISYEAQGQGAHQLARAKLVNTVEGLTLTNRAGVRASKLCSLGERGCADPAAQTIVISGKSENSSSTITGDAYEQNVVRYQKPGGGAAEAKLEALDSFSGTLPAGSFAPAAAKAQGNAQGNAPTKEDGTGASSGARGLASVDLPENARGALDPVQGTHGYRLGSLLVSRGAAGAGGNGAKREKAGESHSVLESERSGELGELQALIGEVDREARQAARAQIEELTLFQRITKQHRKPERLF